MSAPRGSIAGNVQISPQDLRKPLRILQRTETASASGGAVPTYTDLFGAAVWAQDKHRKAIAVLEGGKLVTTVYHMYTIRYNPVITAGLYIQDPLYTNKLYIQGIVDPTGLRQWMELTAVDIEG